MIDSVLIDMDGVANTFHKHVFAFFNLPYSDDLSYPTECGWDIVSAANKLAGYERFTSSTFWNSITREVWATIPISPEFDFICSWAEIQVGRDNVHFLTSPTLSPECVAGKLEWIQQFAPEWMRRQFLIGPSKHLCAKSTTLLIDDSDKNVIKFEGCGGQSILVPRPWNSLHGRDPISVLSEQFKRFNHANSTNN